MRTFSCASRARFIWSVLLALVVLIPWLTLSTAVPQVAAAGPHLYVPSYGNSRLIISNIDGTSPVNKGNLGALSGPEGIALDVKHGKMYITNTTANTVIVANIDGTSATTVVFSPAVALSAPRGIALDLANGQMYIANSNANNIVKANLNGTGAATLGLNGYLSQPWGIALYPSLNMMYVTSYGNDRIVSAYMSGASPAITSSGAPLNGPAGIAFDFYTNKLYITNNKDNHLFWEYSYGGGLYDRGNPGLMLSGASGIAVDHANANLYIASASNSRIVRTDLNGGSATNLTAQSGWAGVLLNPYFVALDSPPDVSATLTSNAMGSIPVGGGFDWTVNIVNSGPNPAIFDPSQVILRDNLPAGPTYLPASISGNYVANKSNVSCSIASNVLTCTALTGTVSIEPSYEGLEATVPVLPSAVGTLTNPSGGGVCRADPNHVLGESNLLNNDCSGSVTVRSPDLARGRKLYATDYFNNLVARANLDGTGATDLGNPGGLLSHGYGLALDLTHEKMYLSRRYPAHIIRANLDGTGGQDLGNLNGLISVDVRSIALDVANNRMYVTDSFFDRVIRADLNGNNAAIHKSLSGLATKPVGIALDLVHNMIYVTGAQSNNVFRFNLDGTGGQNLGSLNSLLSAPGPIAVDPVHGKMYVGSGNNFKLVEAGLDGTAVVDLGSLGSQCGSSMGAVALDVPGGYLYVACSNRIVRAKLDGSGPVNLGSLNGMITYGTGLALDLRPMSLYLPLVLR